MPDPFLYADDRVDAPSRSAFAVTTSDATNYVTTGRVPKALFVGGAGNVCVQLVDDAGTVTFTGVPAGSILPIRPQRILATGTTATNIVAFA